MVKVIAAAVVAACVAACAPAATCTRELAGVRTCDEADNASAWLDECAGGVLARGACERAGALAVRCVVVTRSAGTLVRRYYAPTREGDAQTDCQANAGRLERAP